MIDYCGPRALVRAYMEELRETGVEYLPCVPAATIPSAVAAAPPEPPIQMESLEAIRADLGECQRCQLGSSRINLVFGTGNPHAEIVFVGEGPGRDEDQQGEPFVGAAGQLLTKIIQAMGYQRHDVYICNVVKCRPPQNRDPRPEEVAACAPFLLRQIQALSPGVIVALGKFAAQTLLETTTLISRLRGTFHDFHGIPLMPTFHPSALLRDPSLKAPVWHDMQQVLKLLGKEPPQKK